MNYPQESQQTERKTYESSYVGGLFDSIAHRYDLLNHVLSFGFDFGWRTKAIRFLQKYKPESILDVATGTADLAIAAATLNPRSIVGIDISERMLERGRIKIDEANLSSMIQLERGAAESMPFSDETFDAAIVAFGVRNFSNLGQGLREMFRVVKRDGVVVILEFSTPRGKLIQQAYRLYSRHVLPRIGGFLSRNRSAYEYLPATVNEFPDGEEFAGILHGIGFQHTMFFPLTFGIATVYVAQKSAISQPPAQTSA